MTAEREGLSDDPFALVWSMAREAGTSSARYIQELLREESPREDDMRKLKQRVSTSEKSKAQTYCTDINPNLEIHPVYTAASSVVPEYQRLAFSRLRLSAHRLAIETGRWTRTPRDRRLCTCGQVQTEQHVIGACPTTAHIRAHHSDINSYQLPSFFDEDPAEICTVSYKCLVSY